MGELEALIRQIVRDEVRLCLKGLKVEESTGDNFKEITETVSNQFDYELFERKYQAALEIDDEIRQRYQSQVQLHGKTVTLEQASEILSMSKYAIRKLSKTDPNFPMISHGSIDTARVMHWLDGGKAYWKLSDNGD